MGNKEEKNRIIWEAMERGFVFGAIHSGIDGKESDRFVITEPLHFAGWYLYGGEEGCIYNGGRWAKIIMPARKPLFITEDGVKMYGGEQYWFFSMKWVDPRPISSRAQACDLSDCNIRFSTLNAAEYWIASQKQKQKEADLIREAERRGFVMGVKHTETGDLGLGYYFTIDDDLHFTNGKLYGGKNGCIYNGKEWATVELKPKSLKPEDLVEGEIYFDDDGENSSIFRFKTINGYAYPLFYSRIFDGEYIVGWWCIRYNFLRPATLEEKQKLVKAEVNNGFFYKL